METVKKRSADNIGSIVKIEVVRVKDVLTFPIPGTTSAILSDVVLNTGISWEEIYFTPETAQIIDADTLGDAGNNTKYSITAKTPYVNKDSDETLNSYLRYPLLVKTTDANGIVRLFGTTDVPALLSYQRSNPAQSAGYNGYEVTITGEQVYSAIFITA